MSNDVMNQEGYSLVLLDNARSRSYIQNFIKVGFLPREVIVLVKDINRIDKSPTKQHNIITFSQLTAWYDEKESVFETLDKSEICYKVISTLDVNSEEAITEISALPSKYILYSGPAGILLKSRILECGKVFIHAHPGVLPEFKGSTTVYYSSLMRGEVGCSVMIMNEKIDSGELLHVKCLALRKGFVDLDSVDILLRTETLLELLVMVDGDLSLAKKTVQESGGNEFRIIHPLMKHMAIMKMTSSKDTLKFFDFNDNEAIL